jgi:hypothetical protein
VNYFLKAIFTFPLSSINNVYYTMMNIPSLVDLDQRSEIIDESVEQVLDQADIRKDLVFSKILFLDTFAQAGGTNFFTNSGAAIFIIPDFPNADRDACNFILKHEIAHIKYNDIFTFKSIPAICQLSASIYGIRYLSFFRAVGLTYAVFVGSLFSWTTWRESKADDFAIQHSSNEELKGGRRFFQSLQKVIIDHPRRSFFEKLRFSDRGEDRIDLFHPSLASRIHKIENEMSVRNIQVDDKVESEKLTQLIRFVKKCY